MKSNHCRNLDVDIEGKFQSTILVNGLTRCRLSIPAEIAAFWNITAIGSPCTRFPSHIAQLKPRFFRWNSNVRPWKQMAKLCRRPTAPAGNLWYLIYRLQTEPYRRLSNGFTCLCFVLIGLPVAMLWRHADVLTNFFVCFMPILAVYYPLLMLSEDLSTSGKLWPISFWMSNAVFIASGILLLRRIVQH